MSSISFPSSPPDIESIRNALHRMADAPDMDAHIWDVRLEQIHMELDRLSIVELRRSKFIERFICDQLRHTILAATEAADKIMGPTTQPNTIEPNNINFY